jgi:hypothetical protein
MNNCKIFKIKNQKKKFKNQADQARMFKKIIMEF